MSKNLHFILVPLFAQGHFIPMVDLARLIAARNFLVTLVTTPVNASRINPIIEREKLAGVPIQLLILDFPFVEAGLPSGCESFELILETQLVLNFFDALEMLQFPLLQRLRDIQPKPSCIITDYSTPWTEHVANELRIPRLMFHGPSCFYLLSVLNVYKHNNLQGSSVEDYQSIIIPDMPVQVEVNMQQARAFFDMPGFENLHNRVIEAEATADGFVMNTFEELESEYIERYAKSLNKKVWPIGPVSLCNRDISDRVQRGNNCSVDRDIVLGWLDAMEDNSVVYVSFGTVTMYNNPSLIEIGLGLEASNLPFIWVIRDRDWRNSGFQKWFIDYKFESRIRKRGFIIDGWSPQTLILSHRAVGAFVTHSGWNSTLEALSAGVPMVTWPYYADQFLNAKFIVEVLKVGVALQVEMLVGYKVGEDEVVVKREEVEKALTRVMDRGEEGEERRKRAKELANKAKKAMEHGGSSYNNLTCMIQYIMDLNKDKL